MVAITLTDCCRVKRSYAATSEVYEVNEPHPNTGISSGGPVQNYPYDQQNRGYLKRQRSDSDYNSPVAYSTYGRGTMEHYGMPSSSAYGHQPQPPQHNPQSQMAHMVTTVQQSIMPSWQHPHPSYSAPPSGSGMGVGGASYYGANTGNTQAARGQTYGQTSPLYGARASSELYSNVNNLPTPVSEQSIGSAQSSLGGYGQQTQLGTGLSSRGPPVQPYDLSNPSAQYAPQQHNYSQSAQAYQPPSTNVSFEHHASNPLKIEAHGYTDSPNVYHVPPQQSAYSGGGVEGFSSSDLPLGSSMLNREFSGASAYAQPPPQAPPPAQEPGGDAGAYSGMHVPTSDMSGYRHVNAKSAQPHPQQQSAAYPTPHQTSPTQLQDHG